MNATPVGQGKRELDSPALCLDAAALERNISRMGDYFGQRPAALRPHCKTHKCPTIAWMQLRAGAIGITCAKLGEAEVMAQAGIRDLLIANQIIGSRKTARLVNLAAYSDVMVAVDDADNAADLSAAAVAKGLQLRVLLEVNVGMNRCGVEPGEDGLRLARRVVSMPGLQFEGIMGYEGHTVMRPDRDERRRAAQEAMSKLVATRDLLEGRGIPVPIVSAGGTGTYDITGNYEGITEIQAGSYATMDSRYRDVGIDYEHALTLIARVISLRGPDLAIIDAGKKALTQEFGPPPVMQPQGWALTKLSEEHGFLTRGDGDPVSRGDLVEIIPSHGCTTINLHDAYYVTRDDTLEGVWSIAARGCIR